MHAGLANLNESSKPYCLDVRNDRIPADWYVHRMAPPHHDWYFKQWLEHLHVKQADIVRHLDWNKSKASLMFNDKQRYHRDDVNQVASYLQIEPFELLIPPERAMALRQYRASAEQIVTLAHDADDVGKDSSAEDAAARGTRTGTDG